jgi:hypothetical protein
MRKKDGFSKVKRGTRDMAGKRDLVGKRVETGILLLEKVILGTIMVVWIHFS